MRNRSPIPDEYKNWLDAYLARKGLKNYPNLDANQWRTLQGAYRQMLLKNKSVSNGIGDKTLFNRNMELVAERDKALAELRSVKNTVLSKAKTIEKHKQEISLLKKQLKQAPIQVLGSGVYDGGIPLSIAVKLLATVPKESGKQSALRKLAIIDCGYTTITERKLNPSQKVAVYQHIVKLYPPA